MKRVYFILGFAHVLFVGAAVAFYAGNPIVACFLGVLAAFGRMMAPSQKKIDEKGTRKVLQLMELLGWFLMFLWLSDNGLDELIDKAWSERFSARPIVGISVILTVVFIRDWRWMLGLSNDEVIAFYAKEPQTGRGE